jgi:antagonist of KipI
MITVTKAPPYLTLQDRGRRASRSAGVPEGGAMDSFALAAAKLLVGNRPNSAVLEWALGGGSLRFERACAFALAGAQADVTLGGAPALPLTTIHAREGEELAVGRITAGRFLYLAFSGGIDAPIVLGSRSTYLPARFGGVEGRMIRTGDRLQLGNPPRRCPESGFTCPADLVPDYQSEVVRGTRGTHADLLPPGALDAFAATEYRVATASDRTGYRLDGEPLPSTLGALPSETGCPGTVQLPGDGRPIALMSDAPTVGGYAKIAVVASSDLPILSQRSPGERVRFEMIEIDESQRLLRARAADLDALRRLARDNSPSA